MILQALHQYYQRMVEDPDSDMPTLGTSMENISFALVLDRDGQLQGIEDLREVDGKKLRPRKMAVPAAVTRTSGVKANFLWDKATYVFGADADGATEANELRFSAFQSLVQSVTGCLEDDGLTAVKLFLQHWDCTQAGSIVSQFFTWEEVCASNLVFRLDGVSGFIHSRPAIQKKWLEYGAEYQDSPRVQCLITGEKDLPQALVHTPIKGVQGGQTSGGYIVSFNATAFTSYGRDKADVAELSAFAYTTALNALLAGKKRQRVVVGDTTVTYWAERSSPAEEFFAELFDPPQKDEKNMAAEDDVQTTQAIHDVLSALRAGRRVVDIVPDLDDSVQFYVLGLAPNAARLSIRFWEVNSLALFLKRVGTHYRQLSMVRQFDSEPEFPPLWRLLCQTATLGKSENVSPVLSGGMARAVLSGASYPQNLLTAVLGRIRAEHIVSYFRAALLKAYLMRNHQMEVPVALDVNRKDQPYLLGRLFAVLEKAQEDAIPGTNATIKDRYISSASATPGRVFSLLLKNVTNHIAKLRKDTERRGSAIHYEIMIQEIVEMFDNFPTVLSLEEQGLFMIGYYHQRKAFYTKKNQEG